MREKMRALQHTADRAETAEKKNGGKDPARPRFFEAPGRKKEAEQTKARPRVAGGPAAALGSDVREEPGKGCNDFGVFGGKFRQTPGTGHAREVLHEKHQAE